jgi:type I restriction enzyme S subunit
MDQKLITNELRDNLPGLRDQDVARIEAMWVRAAPFLDANFRSALPAQFHQRVWELYLASALVEQGAEITPRRELPEEGPDFRIQTKNGPLWIEAIAPTSGTGEDAVPENPVTSPPTAYSVPGEQVKLRYTAALREKLRKHQDYLAKGVVEADPFVIALSASNVRSGKSEALTPRILQTLFGIGNHSVVLDISGEEPRVIAEGPTEQRSIRKQSGASVTSRVFLGHEYTPVSGALFSYADPWNYPQRAGADFIFAHNPLASSPLPAGWLQVGREYRCEEHTDGWELRLIQHND